MEEDKIKDDGPVDNEHIDDMTPMLEKDEDVESSATNVNWDENKFVWDLSELEILNNQRELDKQKKIVIIMRLSHQDLGIRAHPEMTIGKCLYSIFLIHQNEFIFIWLWLSFAIYFWVEIALILSKDDSIGF
jgi:hypothetical protein